jgi:DNA-binding response OmpR family regulator
MKKSKILIIEDNPNTKRFLEAMLGRDFEILGAGNGVLGVEYARTQSPDLIILDVVLPILSGYDACSLLKKDNRTKHIPIIFLSSKSSKSDTAQGLSVGADDYLPKPFDYKELLARIKARLTKPEQQPTPMVIVGELTIDPTAREVMYQGKKTRLTLTEFDILRLLAERIGNVVSREEILKNVWKEESVTTNDRTIDVHIRALRKKMPSLSKRIHSIYGIGYKFDPELRAA